MIGYTMVGVQDIEKAGKFYDALLSEFGAKRGWESDKFIAWGTGEGTSFCVTLPFDGQNATVGNGTMIALQAASLADVNRIYAAAMGAGATDEGQPGYRGGEEAGFYAGYFRDPDGNKLNIFFMKSA